MSQPTSIITESHLRVNLNEAAHALVRELAMASRKMSIYGEGHPQSIKAVEKPFFLFSSIFRYRSYVGLNVQRGNLYLLNIRLKESPFTAQILQFLQAMDVQAILFERSMRIQDFTFFVNTLVTRQYAYDATFSFTNYLKQHKVDCIEVNSERGYDLFENRKQYRGDVDADFSVRRLVLDQLGDDPVALTRVRNANQHGLLELGIDSEPELVAYLLPEKVASFDAGNIRRLLTELADKVATTDTGPLRIKNMTDDYVALFKLVDYHPEKKNILKDMEDRRYGSPVDDGKPLSETGAIKIESAARIDQLIDKLFSYGASDAEAEAFGDAFLRLLKTGQQPKAAEVFNQLIELMSAPEPTYRQQALNLLEMVTYGLVHTANGSVLETGVTEACQRLADKTETYEYSEFLWLLFDVCRKAGRYDQAARLTRAMAGRRSVNGNVTVYDSMAVKKGFENISRRQTIDVLISTMLEASGDEVGYIREVLVSIGSEQVAHALAGIISHPLRPVRRLTLKILADLGKASLKVFSHIMYDDSMFERDENRHDLPDQKWYVVRNSIFVLGSLHDEQGVAPLRNRIDDRDVRVRREIITALEKIGGEEAVDCLTLMAEDPITEVRETAIVAIGLIGEPEAAPILIDIGRKDPRNSIKAVTALGKLGGEQARLFLGQLLDEPERLADLASTVVSKDALRLAAVKALGQIGDQEAIGYVRKFKENQSASQKIFFRNSTVNKTVNDILLRH